MNKYLFQALTQAEDESGHSGYETVIYDESLVDATARAVEYFNDSNRTVSLIGSAIVSLSESPFDEGSTHWSVVVNGKEVAFGDEDLQEEAEEAASNYVIYEVEL